MKINFQNDTIKAFGESIPLITTTSRHYAIPLTQNTQVINNTDRESSTRVNLLITENKSNKAMILKIHRQFAHPTPDKTINLINNAGIPWSNNKELKEEIQKISENCSLCKIYKKTPQDLLWDYPWPQHSKRQ